MSELLSLLFSENTHTRTDTNFKKWLISFIWKCLSLYPCFFWKRAHTYRYRCYKDGRFFIRTFLPKHAQTHRNQFYTMDDFFFHIKMSRLSFFFIHVHTHKCRCYKHGRFFICIFGQNTHTRTDINFTQWMISFFISKCPTFYTWFFLKQAHTHRCRCYKDRRFFICIYKKEKKNLAHTHRYELYIMADFFHLKMSEFLSLLFFSENTHTRTDMNLTKSLICFISIMFKFSSLLISENTHPRTDIDVIKMVDFSSLFFLKTRTHAQIWTLQNGWFVSSQNV